MYFEGCNDDVDDGEDRGVGHDGNSKKKNFYPPSLSLSLVNKKITRDHEETGRRRERARWVGRDSLMVGDYLHEHDRGNRQFCNHKQAASRRSGVPAGSPFTDFITSANPSSPFSSD